MKLGLTDGVRAFSPQLCFGAIPTTPPNKILKHLFCEERSDEAVSIYHPEPDKGVSALVLSKIASVGYNLPRKLLLLNPTCKNESVNK